MSLLPPNSSALERALEAATARVGDVPIGTAATLWDPALCPAGVLPWLAWSLSVDSWDSAWPIATKRAACAEAISEHRRKGTRATVEQVLARLDALAELVEWWQATPPAPPHTVEVRLPIAAEDIEPGGSRATGAFADAIVAELAKVKPLREHLVLVQTLASSLAVGLLVVIRAAGFARIQPELTEDTSPVWATLLLTEDGEPLSDPAGTFLELTP